MRVDLNRERLRKTVRKTNELEVNGLRRHKSSHYSVTLMLLWRQDTLKREKYNNTQNY